MTRSIAIAIALLMVASYAASAAVTTQALWRMGEEAGDTAGNFDSSGNGHTLSTNGGPTEATASPAPTAAGSTVYASAPGAAGYFGFDTSANMTANDWGVSLWVRPNASQSKNILVVNGGSPQAGDLKIGQIGGVWGPSYHGVAWIGATGGTGQTAAIGEWTHLAIVDEGGTSTFYINGIAQAGTPATAAGVWGTGMHLAVDPGGAGGWSGDLDEVRMFTFGTGEFERTEFGLGLINGSFEADGAGPTAQAWSLTGNVGVSTTQTTSDGTSAIAFNGANATPNGVVEQTFNTIAGQQYELRFDFGKFATGGGTAQLDVDVFDAVIGDGVLLLDEVVSDASGATTNATVYNEFIYRFFATGTTTTLRFTDTSIGTNSFDAMLDDVVIFAAPAPGALSAGLAMIGLAAARRRRRHR